MMAVAFRPTFCSSCLVPKSTLLHNPEAQYGFVPKHSLHGGKNTALRAEKQLTSPDLPEGEEGLRATDVDRIKVCILSYVAEQCVVISWLVREYAHRHKAMRSAQKLEESRHRQRGF